MVLVDKPHFYFMHVGKTGGTYASNAVRALNKRADLDIVFGSHRLRLPKIVEGDPDAKVIFGLRHPLEIFVSGFFSRQRKGAPTYHSEWSRAEEKAFTTFATPNELAEALNASDADRLAAAQHAMGSIQHVKKCLNFYLGSAEILEQRKDNVFFILDQEHLDDDLDLLFARFDLTVPGALRKDQGRKHRNPNKLDTHLSPRAIENLEKHYETDIGIFHKCKELREQITRAGTG